MSIKRQKPEADTLTVLRDHTFVTIRKTHNSKSSPELPLTNFLRSPWAISHRQATKLRTVWEKHHPGGTRRAGWPPGAEILGGEGPHPRVAAAGAPPAPPENPWPPPPLAAVPQHGEHLPPSSLSPAARCPERCPHPAMAVRGGSTHCTAPSASGAGAVRGQRESERASEVRPSARPSYLPAFLPPALARPTREQLLSQLLFSSALARLWTPERRRRGGSGLAPPRPRPPRQGRPARWPPSPSGRFSFPCRGAQPSEPPVRGPCHGRPRCGEKGERCAFGSASLSWAALCCFDHSPPAPWGSSWDEDFLDLASWVSCWVPSCLLWPGEANPLVVLLLPALAFEQGSELRFVELVYETW